MIGGHETVLGVATCHDELIEVLRVRKAALGLSNELLDHLMPATSGHCDKLLGPSQERGLSRSSLDGMLSALGLQLLVAVDPVQSARMQPQWESRDAKQVRPPARLAAALVKRARPLVLSQLARKANDARWSRVSPELRSRLMRELAKARWRASADA
jgi:hypothetical protein